VLGAEQGDGEVFARATFGEAPPERLDEATQEILEHVLPALRIQDGFNGALILVERGSGKVLGVTLWESEQAMDATEEAAHWLRVFSAEAAGGMVTGVGRYDVLFSEVKGSRP
jgi:heme-degrading monooxygenase HmoA